MNHAHKHPKLTYVARLVCTIIISISFTHGSINVDQAQALKESQPQQETKEGFCQKIKQAREAVQVVRSHVRTYETDRELREIIQRIDVIKERIRCPLDD